MHTGCDIRLVVDDLFRNAAMSLRIIQLAESLSTNKGTTCQGFFTLVICKALLFLVQMYLIRQSQNKHGGLNQIQQ